MTIHTFKMTEAHAERVHALVSSHMQAIKNWTASAVETGDFEYAQKLVRDLREHEKLFAAFNMTAKHTIADHTGKELVTVHSVNP